jgi:hypothetical protein
MLMGMVQNLTVWIFLSWVVLFSIQTIFLLYCCFVFSNFLNIFVFGFCRKIHWKTILKPVSDNPKDQNPKDLALEVLFLFRLIAYEEFLHLDDYRIVLCWEIMRTLFPCISIALFRYLYFNFQVYFFVKYSVCFIF